MSSDREASQDERDPVAGPTVPSLRRRFQFSLATLMWLTTLAACLAALWAMYRDLQHAKAEVRAVHDEVQKYRGEMGYLDISDPRKIYARGVRAMGDYKWSWRIYLPPKPRFQLCLSTKQIPVEGFPIPRNKIAIIEPGEHLLNVDAERGRDGKWPFRVKIVDGSGFGSDMEPLDDGFETGGVSETHQEAADPGSRLVLMRLRKCKITQGSPQGNHTSVVDPQPCDGLMIWIEPVK